MSKSNSLAKVCHQGETDLELPSPSGDAGLRAVGTVVLPESAMAGAVAGARDLQAQLADAFSQEHEGDAIFLDEERYPLALTVGVTTLICGAFWTMVVLGAQSLLAG